MKEIFNGDTFLIRKKILKLIGAAFHVYNENNEVIMYSKLKGFKLKEDIRIYTGEDMQTELLCIKARNYFDISTTYDVFDATTNEKVGALKRKGLKSILQDEWLFIDANEQQIGNIKEDSLLLALVRRFLLDFLPQKFNGYIGENNVCTFEQNFNPFVSKITVSFKPDVKGLLDKRLGMAAAVLLCGIEGKQG